MNTKLPVLFPTKLEGCKRELYYIYSPNFKRSPNIIPSQAVFYSIPNYIHEGLQKRMKFFFGNSVEVEKTITKTYKSFILQGRIDAHFPNEKTIIEIKTFVAGPYKGYKPSNREIQQLTIYMDMLVAETGYLVRIDRKSGKMKATKIHKDPDIIHNVHSSCRKIVDDIIKPGKIPEAISGFGSPTKCDQCGFSIDNGGFCHRKLSKNEVEAKI